MNTLVSQMNSLNVDTNIDSLFSNLSLKKQRIILPEANDEVKIVMENKRLTKKLKTKFSLYLYNTWYKKTYKRYERYEEDFFNDENEKFNKIISYMKLVLKNFRSNNFDKKSQIDLVYFVDKMLVKLFVSWNVIQ